MSSEEVKEELSPEELENQEEVKDKAEDSQEIEENDTKDSDPTTEWKEKFQDVNDKYLRLYSEFDNFRRRTQKEKLDLYKTAGEDIMTALLPVLDDFERALKSIQESEKQTIEGVELIHNKLISTLKKHGLEPIESSIGKVMDVDLHEAVTKIPAPNKKMKGKIIDEVEKGYRLHDKVIRFTKVVVGE